MTELEVLLDDYFKDYDYIAQQMIAWCDPSPELINRIKRYENRHKAWKKLRKAQNEKPRTKN